MYELARCAVCGSADRREVADSEDIRREAVLEARALKPLTRRWMPWFEMCASAAS